MSEYQRSWIDHKLGQLGIDIRQPHNHVEMREYLALLKEEIRMTEDFLSNDGAPSQPNTDQLSPVRQGISIEAFTAMRLSDYKAGMTLAVRLHLGVNSYDHKALCHCTECQYRTAIAIKRDSLTADDLPTL